MVSFKEDIKITEFLKKHPFTVSAEIIPPRNGMEHAQALAQIDALVKAGAQFLSVTKGAGGSLRGGSLPIAQSIKELFQVPCIAHFTCRDLTPFDCENQLIDHHYFGIRNILALRGDPPDGQTEWKPKDGGYSFAYELMRQIREMNQGRYLKRLGGPEATTSTPTQFCIGGAVYPEHPNPKERIEFFKIKVENGAEYGITDMIFQPEIYGDFIEKCAAAGVSVPVLPGTRVLKSQTQAARIMKKFRVTIPAEMLSKLPEKENEDSEKIGIDLFLKWSEEIQKRGAPGAHLYVIADTKGSSSAITRLKTIV